MGRRAPPTIAGLTVANTYDQFLRPTALALQQSSNPIIQQSFSFDAAHPPPSANSSTANSHQI